MGGDQSLKSDTTIVTQGTWIGPKNYYTIEIGSRWISFHENTYDVWFLGCGTADPQVHMGVVISTRSGNPSI